MNSTPTKNRVGVLQNLIQKATLSGCLFLCSAATAQSVDDNPYWSLIARDADITSQAIPSPLKEYLTHYSNTLKHLLHSSISYDEYERERETISNILDTVISPNLAYYRAEITLQASLVALKNKKQFEAAWLFRKAYKAVSDHLEKYPSHMPGLKTMGFMEVMLGAVPKKYQWLLSLAGMQGSVTEGMQKLQKAMDEGVAIAREATIITALLQAYILDRPQEAWESILRLHTTEGIENIVKMAIAMKAGKSRDMIRLFQHLNPPPFPVMHYLIAEGYLQSGRYQQAEKEYQAYLTRYPGSANKKDSYFKRYLIANFQQDTAKARRLKKRTIDFPEVISAADRLADELIGEPDALNFDMMKLRLATDGGFYERADSLSSTVKLHHEKDSVEFGYRIARLCHKKGDTERAIEGYLSTLESRPNSWYFVPNSALQLGYIYTETGDLDRAAYYFDKVRQYKGYQYESSIGSKAEAGLNQLKALSDAPNR